MILVAGYWFLVKFWNSGIINQQPVARNQKHVELGKYFKQTYGTPLKKCDEAFYEFWFNGPMDILLPDWP